MEPNAPQAEGPHAALWQDKCKSLRPYLKCEMRTLLLFLVASAGFAADWDAVRQISAGRKIEIIARDGGKTRADFVSADAEVLTFREESGPRSLTRPEIRRVRVFDPRRRVFKGLLWMGIGAAAGGGIGAGVCPYCANEGHGYRYVGPGVAVGAGVGALGFLSSPYRTVYKGK